VMQRSDSLARVYITLVSGHQIRNLCKNGRDGLRQDREVRTILG